MKKIFKILLQFSEKSSNITSGWGKVSPKIYKVVESVRFLKGGRICLSEAISTILMQKADL